MHINISGAQKYKSIYMRKMNSRTGVAARITNNMLMDTRMLFRAQSVWKKDLKYLSKGTINCIGLDTSKTFSSDYNNTWIYNLILKNAAENAKVPTFKKLHSKYYDMLHFLTQVFCTCIHASNSLILLLHSNPLS